MAWYQQTIQQRWEIYQKSPEFCKQYLGRIAALGVKMTNDDEVAYFKTSPTSVIRELEDKKIDIAR